MHSQTRANEVMTKSAPYAVTIDPGKVFARSYPQHVLSDACAWFDYLCDNSDRLFLRGNHRIILSGPDGAVLESFKFTIDY